jgi:hypothetical protein
MKLKTSITYSFHSLYPCIRKTDMVSLWPAKCPVRNGAPKLEDREYDDVLHQGAVIDVNGVMMNWWLVEETDETRENLLQCHFDHHESYTKSPGIQPEPPRWENGVKPPEHLRIVYFIANKHHSCLQRFTSQAFVRMYHTQFGPKYRVINEHISEFELRTKRRYSHSRTNNYMNNCPTCFTHVAYTHLFISLVNFFTRL